MTSSYTPPATVPRRLPLGECAGAVPPLGSTGTLICYADPARFELPELRARLFSTLNDEERERMARFRFERDRRNYLVAHALLRGLLAREVDGRPEELQFSEGPHGRPELVQTCGPRRLRFNLSHTHGLVACGLCWERDIGVDVEHVERQASVDDLAGQVLAPAERADLEQQTVEHRRPRFFEYWTLKEAYLKAVGQGLGLPLRSIAFSVNGPPPVAAAQVAFFAGIDDDADRLCYRCWPVGHAHQLALAVEWGSAQSLSLAEVSPEVLLSLL